MSTIVTKRGMDYRCEWDSETDILRVFEDNHPEPVSWVPVSNKHGIDAGVIQLTSDEADEAAAPDSSRAVDPDWDCKRIVALRMHKASKRPELTFENALGFHYKVNGFRLNMLRHGHSGLLKLPEIPKPLTLKEAADNLAEAVRHGALGETRRKMRMTEEAGFSDPADWLDHALTVYETTRELAP